MTTGDRIKKARKEAGLTQRQLGEKMGVSESMVRMYESGRRNPKTETLEKISDSLGVSADYLSGKSDYKLNELRLAAEFGITLDPSYTDRESWARFIIDSLGETNSRRGSPYARLMQSYLDLDPKLRSLFVENIQRAIDEALSDRPNTKEEAIADIVLSAQRLPADTVFVLSSLTRGMVLGAEYAQKCAQEKGASDGFNTEENN